jgi:hypothetical protein
MRLLGVTVNQFVKTGVIAVVFIVVFKLAADKSGVGGLKTLADKV